MSESSDSGISTNQWIFSVSEFPNGQNDVFKSLQ